MLSRILSSPSTTLNAILPRSSPLSTWRDNDISAGGAWPNYKHEYRHRKHFFPYHTYGVQRETLLRCVDNSKIGREAMAEGRPPRIFKVFGMRHYKRPHSTIGKLGDKVMVAVKGERKIGIIVGLKVNQLPFVPRFDSNNVVLIEESGNPIGTRIHAAIPNCIRPILKANTFAKKADYTKLLAIATKFV